MDVFQDNHAEWVKQVSEPILDPDQPIIDPHHHLWLNLLGQRYAIEEFTADTQTGHNIVGSVYMECGAEYRTDGPEAERSLGETAFVLDQREQQAEDCPPILGMVGHVDLILGDGVRPVLEAHRELAGDFFKGIRHALASAEPGAQLFIPGPSPRDLSADPNFRRGVQVLGEMGLVYESWHYHYQNRDFMALAQACPDTTFVLDHFGTPLGVPPYDSDRDAIFAQWQQDMADLSACNNVFLKLGGLAMPDNGYGWHTASRPPTSDEFVQTQGHWYRHALDCFGPSRCLFESNFPVDRLSLGYGVLYNAFKKLAADFSGVERDALFFGTANSLYGLGLEIGDYRAP